MSATTNHCPQVVEHYDEVRPTESYAALPRSLADAVAGELAARHARVLRLLGELRPEGAGPACRRRSPTSFFI